MYRISNEGWAYATADSLFVGEEDQYMTPFERYEALHWEQECRDMARTESTYGDCGRSIVGTGDYEQMLAEEARSAYGLPAHPYA